MKKPRAFNSENLPVGRENHQDLPKREFLDLEIGAGTGAFAIQYASDHPERGLISIEHTKTKFQKFERSLTEASPLLNLVSVHANAISWVAQNLELESIDRIFLLYPNPNPKKKHLNKRWHAMPFMERLKSVLKTRGELTLVTNEKWYMDEAQEYLTTAWGLQIKENLCFSRETLPYKQPRTLFERKYLERGDVCYQLTLIKP